MKLIVERVIDRKSTRLKSSHLVISYAVFCLKKKDQFTRSGETVPLDAFHVELGTVGVALIRVDPTHDTLVFRAQSRISGHSVLFFFLMIRRATRSTLFPYTSLCRS